MSYWTAPCKEAPQKGFRNVEEHKLAWQMSSRLLRRHFDDVVLVTDEFGWEYLRPLDLPFTDVRLDLEDVDPGLSRYWSFGKLKAYEIQDRPFVHVDTDAFMFKRLPDRILNAPICTQLPEKFSRGKPPGWYRLDEMVAKVKRLPERVTRAVCRPIQYATCCGLYGGNDLGTIRAHCDLVKQCLQMDPQGWASLDAFVALLICEQWMLAIAVQERKSFIEYLYHRCFGPTGAMDEKRQREIGFVHLWSDSKRNPDQFRRVKEWFDETYETSNPVSTPQPTATFERGASP